MLLVTFELLSECPNPFVEISLLFLRFDLISFASEKGIIGSFTS